MELEKSVVGGVRMTIPLELSECPICSSKQAKFLFTKENQALVQCGQCGLVYKESASTLEQNEEFYRKNYYENFGSQVEKINRGRQAFYQDLLKTLHDGPRPRRLLDIGCGYGDFLKLAEADGWEVWGIEPSQEACESARATLGPCVLNQTIDTADFSEGQFDLITLWNVIDCLPDPLSALKRIQKWLAPDGSLIIRTPNVLFHLGIYRIFSNFRPLLKKLGWKKEASVFLRTNYDSKTLQKLLTQGGFSDIRIEHGKPTTGDAYQVFSAFLLAAIAKNLLYGFSQTIAFLTGNKLLIGSNLMAWASKRVVAEPVSQAVKRRIVAKRFVLYALAVIGYIFGLPLLCKWLGKDRRIRILRYHGLSEFNKSDVNVHESEFIKQMNFLKSHYSVISLEKAVQYLERGEIPSSKSFVVTFDDGYEDNYKVAFPILRRRNLPATIFLLTGQDRQIHHLQYDPPEYSRLLSWEAVKEMVAWGITFGSHGETHQRLTDLSREKVSSEFILSKRTIESVLGRPIEFLSYPYGTAVDFDFETESLAKEAGYRAAFSAIFGANGKESNLFALRRIGIEASDTLFTFHAKLNGALDLLIVFDWVPLRKFVRWIDSIFLKPIPKSTAKKSPLLLVSVDFPPHTDGVSTISKEIGARIAQRGEEVVVIAPKDRRDKEFDRNQLYQVIRIPGYEWGYLRFFFLLFQMPGVVYRYRVRRVLAMNIAYGGVLSWALSFFIPLKYLIFAYGYEFEKVNSNPLLRRFYLAIYRKAKSIVTCSELVRQRLILFGVQPDKIKTLYPAVDFQRYRPACIPSSYLEEKGIAGRRILLTVGRLVERKGHDMVIQILPEIVRRFPNVLYCIVGIGSYEKNLREKVRKLHLENYVRFMGKVPAEELPNFYNACEIFVMASREIKEGGHIEGFGIVYLEANACGKPVIGGRSGGVVEAIQEGKTGFLVDPNSPQDLQDKVIELLSNPERARTLGELGLKWVRETFNWEEYSQQVHRLIQHDHNRD